MLDAALEHQGHPRAQDVSNCPAGTTSACARRGAQQLLQLLRGDGLGGGADAAMLSSFRHGQDDSSPSG
jgi:hypothetical protein